MEANHESSKTKRETRVAKMFQRNLEGRLKAAEPAEGGTSGHAMGVPLACSLCAGQSRSGVHTPKKGGLQQVFVPVVDKNQVPLMPTKPSRARRWIKEGKATPFWKKGVFCVRLNVEPSSRKTEPVVVGIDPGSKKEGFSVKSRGHTYLNLEADAVTWVKERVKQRRQMRRARRFRKTPCRANRSNRSRGGIPPSIKARWGWKLRICQWLKKLYPITHFVVEDIKAWTKRGKRKWNRSFSPLEVGKQWFYQELSKLGQVVTKQGFETKKIREKLNLPKDHWIDAWCLAYSQASGPLPDNQNVLGITPFRFFRRQLHRLQPSKGGIRRCYGGTVSFGLKRGSWVKYLKNREIYYVGGHSEIGISLHSLTDGKRVLCNVKLKDIKFLTYSSWRLN